MKMNNYDYVYDFKEELAIVERNSKYGVIDIKGEEILPLIYDFVFYFNKNYYFAVIKDKNYLINKTTLKLLNVNYKVHKNIGSKRDNLMVYYTDDYSIVLFKTGCFEGNLEEFKEAVIRTHNNSKNMKYYNEYMDIIKEYER